MRGEHFWYGRLANVIGFFPANVVQIEQQELSDNSKGASSKIDPTNAHIAKDPSSCTGSNVNEEFYIFDEANLLDDSHKSRVRSKARPPSYIFLKSRILVRSESGENYRYLDVCDDESDWKESTIEIMHKQNLKQVPQKEAISVNGGNVCDTPDWIKTINLKSKSGSNTPVKEKEVPKKIPPWMEEVRKRRESRGNTVVIENSVSQSVSETNTVCTVNTATNKIQNVHQAEVRTVSAVTINTNEVAETRTNITEVETAKQTSSATYRNIVASMSLEKEPLSNKESISEIKVIADLEKEAQFVVKSDGNAETLKITTMEEKSHTQNIDTNVNDKLSTEPLNCKSSEEGKPELLDAGVKIQNIDSPKGININTCDITDKAIPEDKTSPGTETKSLEEKNSDQTDVLYITNETLSGKDTKIEQSTDANLLNPQLDLLNKKQEQNIKTEEKVQLVDEEKVKLILNKLDELESSVQEHTIETQNELADMQRKVSKHYEDVKSSIAQIKTKLTEVLKL